MTPEIESFILLAREDLAVAWKVLPTFPRHAAFHLEQAAEKLVKAVLAAERLDVPRSHHIGALARLLPDDHLWRADLMAWDGLSLYAAATRYPHPGGRMPEIPDEATLRRQWSDVAELVDGIEEWCRNRAGGLP